MGKKKKNRSLAYHKAQNEFIFEGTIGGYDQQGLRLRFQCTDLDRVRIRDLNFEHITEVNLEQLYQVVKQVRREAKAAAARKAERMLRSDQ